MEASKFNDIYEGYRCRAKEIGKKSLTRSAFDVIIRKARIVITQALEKGVKQPYIVMPLDGHFSYIGIVSGSRVVSYIHNPQETEAFLAMQGGATTNNVEEVDRD